RPESLGDFVSTTPDENDVCSVPTLSAAEQNLPMFMTPPDPPTCMYQDPATMMWKEVTRPMDDHPATDIKYEWSNIRLYVTAAYPGTQMVGNLTYTDVTNSCSASYSVIGLWPQISCAQEEVEKDMNDKPLCATADGRVLKTTRTLDPTLC